MFKRIDNGKVTDMVSAGHDEYRFAMHELVRNTAIETQLRNIVDKNAICGTVLAHNNIILMAK